MIVVACILAALVAVPVVDLVRRRGIRRMALRNVARRPGEATLVVVGSMLGTAIIAAAFIVGDTFDQSIRDIARTDLGPIDEVVELEDPAAAEAAEAVIVGIEPVAGIDGTAVASTMTAAIATVGVSPAAAEPSGTLVGIDLADALALDPDPSITGLDGLDGRVADDEIALARDVADDLGIDAGAQVEVHAFDTIRTLTVVGVLPEVGVAGFGAGVVSPGLVADFARFAAGDARPPTSVVLVSNDGGVFDSADDTAVIAAEIQRRLTAAGLGFDLEPVKDDLLADATDEGAELREIFTIVGGFSVLAGVLLLVNLFVMMAEERKTSLGILRALGWRRGRLMRTFALEGALYAFVAAIGGAVVGIGVGRVLIVVTQNIFAGTGSDFELVFSARPASLALAAMVGAIIAMVSIWLTSWRISRLDIIGAIRDLPEVRRRSGWRALAASITGVVAGGLLFAVGRDDPTLVLLGPSVAALCSIGVLGRVAGRAAPVIGGLSAIVWSVAVFGLFPDTMREPPTGVFLLQGIILVAGAVAGLSAAAPMWRRMLSRWTGAAAPAVRLGVAYPVARGFRTALSLSMFALILFSLTFIASVHTVLGELTDDIVDDGDAGHDLLVVSNPSNPLPAGELAAVDGVEHVTTLVRGFADFTASFLPATHLGTETWPLTGVDQTTWVDGAGPALAERDPRFGSDAEVFAAIADDPSLVVVPSWFGDDGGGRVPELGDRLTVRARGLAPHDLTVVGLVDQDIAYLGASASATLVRDLLDGQYAANRQFVAVSAGAEADQVAADITAEFVAFGADAESFRAIVDDDLEREQGLFALLAGYLSLGLVIGTVGLSVVMVRAVRERRRQIGTLRAVGMGRQAIRTVFLSEAGFVALQGIVSGAVLGLLSSYQVISSGAIFEGTDASFAFPGVWLVGLLSVPLMAAAAAAAWPASRAANLAPAVALRVAD